MSVTLHAKTIVAAMVNLPNWAGATLQFRGKAPTVRNIDGMMPPVHQLMVREVSTDLLKHGAFKGKGAYLGLMPKGSVALRLEETLEELVDGLRVFFVGSPRDYEFEISELEVATPAEIAETRAQSARSAKAQEKKARLKQELHAHYDQLLGALAALSGVRRNELPQCTGNCDQFVNVCEYSMEKIIELCDTNNISISTVMMEAVTKTS